MISELNKNYPEMIVEKVSMNRPDHAFNVLNRDQACVKDYAVIQPCKSQV
jgi:hypothetical protein